MLQSLRSFDFAQDDILPIFLNKNYYIIQLCLIVLFCFPVKAENAPIPKNKTQAIKSFEKRLKQETKEKKSLQFKVKDIKKSLSKTKNSLIDIATSIQKNEGQINYFEKRIKQLELKKTELDEQLNTDRSSIVKLIIALEPIKKTPPEAMIARPDAPFKTAQSAMLMGKIIPSINRHAEKLNKNLGTLNQVTEELNIERKNLLNTSENLKQRHSELSSLITKRKELYRKTNKDIKTHEISIKKISLQAKNLSDLVQRIKANEKKQRQQEKITKHIKPKPEVKIIESKYSRLPISGIIRTGYKQKDNLGASSKGLTIEGRAGGLIIAPMNGKIQFTGAFKRYGNIVVIEHANGYHSLIAGLDKISSAIGDHIKSGEPIGVLPNTSLIPRPTLYYELRKNGKPINPSIKFPDLG